MKTIFNFGVLLFLGCTLSAQTFNQQKMDSLFTTIDENDKGMGSFSIFKEGKEVYSKTIGFADVELQKKAGPETKYRIGSISKTFTAAIIMQLVEEKKLSLSTKLFNFYPEIPSSESISIEDMLRHQSGLFNFSNVEDFEQWKTTQQSKAQMLERIRKNGITFQPGEKAEYSNTNYVLLSYIIEDLEKKDLGKVLEKRIFKQLKLKNTYYGGRLDTASGEALSYEKTGKWTAVEQTNMNIVKGAGALTSTPADLNRFFTALFTGKVVKPSSLEKMKEISGEFGIGLIQLPLDGNIFYGHTGGIDGFNSVVVYLPEQNLSISYTSNAREMAPNAILVGAAKIYFGKEYTLPEFKTLVLSTSELKKFEGIYSGEGFPLIITIFEQDGKLMGQAEGQPSFPLEAYESNKFKFDRFNLKLEFNPSEGKMLFKQGPNSHELKRA